MRRFWLFRLSCIMNILCASRRNPLRSIYGFPSKAAIRATWCFCCVSAWNERNWLLPSANWNWRQMKSQQGQIQIWNSSPARNRKPLPSIVSLKGFPHAWDRRRSLDWRSFPTIGRSAARDSNPCQEQGEKRQKGGRVCLKKDLESLLKNPFKNAPGNAIGNPVGNQIRQNPLQAFQADCPVLSG